MKSNKRIIIGISGASGAFYGVETLRILTKLGYQTYLILSEAAEKVIELETEYTVEQVRSLAGFVLDAFATMPSAGQDQPSFDPEFDQLTPREREVLRLIARGYTYKEIARELYISVKTVEHHVSSVLRKLQLSTRHQLTRWATERRLA